MNIKIVREYTIRDLIAGYQNLGPDGVYALGGALEVRPPYQREQVYGIGNNKDEKVIDSILSGGNDGYPIGLMYWCRKDDGSFECLDGQQRIISICEFSKDKVRVTINDNIKKFGDLKADKSPLVEKFLNYKLLVAICETSDYNEKIDWFERINIAGEPLNKQEMRNAVYAGPWATDAKRYFSKDKCTAWHRTNKAFGNIMGNREMTRQLWLEQVILWKVEYDGLDVSDKDAAIKSYMLDHRKNPNANDLIDYFEEMVEWIKRNFTYRKMMEKVDWGHLYNQYHDVELNKSEVKDFIDKLEKNAKDDGITNISGVYEFVFDGDSRHLSERAFSDDIKLAKWDEQNHKCAVCGEDYDIKDLAGDHIIPWSKGGRTVLSNCQLLCATCNGIKSNKWTKEAKEMAEQLKKSK